MSWILNGYAIAYAALLVFFGRLAERYRRNLSFLLGVALFTAASAACAAADSVETLVAFRVLQAAGAALMTPTSLGLLLAAFPPERRGGAVRTWTAIGGLAAALGPLIGGVLVTVNWRWIFLVNVPIGIVAMLIGWWKLPEIPGHDAAAAEPVGRGAGDRRHRRADLCDREGERLGMGFAGHRRQLRGRRRPAGAVRLALPALAQPVCRSRAVPHPAVHRRRAGDGALFGGLRRHAAVGRACGNRRRGAGRR